MKKFSKLLTVALSIGLIGSSFTLTSCKKNKVQTETVTSMCNIQLSNNSFSLCVGDTALLGANLTGGTMDDFLIYRSMDESIVTINEYGFIKALKPGSTEIRAIYGNAIAKCKIDVSLKDNVPSIEIKNILDKSILIDIATQIAIEPTIYFNNDYYDFVPTYKISDPEIAKMEGDTFIPLKNGVVYLTIEGNLFGTQAVSTTLEIVIEDNIVIYMKNEAGIERNNVYLYSYAQIDEEIFVTEFTPSKFGVIVNGVEIESPAIDVDLTDIDGVVNFDSTTKKVSSTNKVGVAQYVITYTDVNSNVFVKTFDVYNNKSVFTYKGATLETDALGAELPVDNIFSDFTNHEIIKATSLDGKTDYNVVDGKVVGLPVIRDDISGEVQDAQYIVYNDTVGFKVSLRTYSKIVKTVQDLEYFNLVSLEDKFDGYYVLNNDINGGGYQVKAHTRTMGGGYGTYSATGLVGIFDGRGHTISNVSLGEGGLFANIGSGGTIKNLGIENITFRSGTGDDTPVLASYLNGAILENVYIGNDYIFAGYNAGLVANNIMNNCMFKDCYFHLQIDDMSRIKSKNYGVFGSMCGQRSQLATGFTQTYSNVVVNSNIPLVLSETNTTENFNNVTTKIKFYVDMEGNPFGNYVTDQDFLEYILDSDITRYYTDQEMKNSENSFDLFSPYYWHVDSNGMLQWGSTL